MFQLKTEYLPGNPEKLGVTRTVDGFNFAVVSEAENIELRFYEKDGRRPSAVIRLDEKYRYGSIYSVEVRGDGISELYYNYAVDGIIIMDPYAKCITGASEFGVNHDNVIYKTPVETASFDWGDDRPLNIPYEDSVIYKMHVRGFTRHPSSKVKMRGTFMGILEKLDYIKELGITAIELMPVCEFEEIQRWTANDKNLLYNPRFNGKVNYWGYTGGLSFAPKSAYCTSDTKDSTEEFKFFVKKLHENGIELIVEMYFGIGEGVNVIHDCVRYWVMEYHIDGVHVICRENALECLYSDPLLSRVKLITTYWGDVNTGFGIRNLSNYNNGFMDVARKFLKGDENMIYAFVEALKRNDERFANINYIANNNGFTLMDLVSYDRKHNELNGENNRDGEDFNNSWNCGAEGVTHKKRILNLRIKQIKNALMMVMLGQGVPLIMAGDEFGNTQDGNNNPYCQDNDISYVKWKNTAYSREILEFTKKLIEFRKKHGVFHNKSVLRDMDYKACGYPDISYHGENAWMANFENYYRNIGIMYCGEYSGDDFIYVAYNMHWEKHSMALPKLPDGYSWKCVFDTSGFNSPDTEYNYERSVTAEERSIVVLTGEKHE